jgi:polyphosphate kinase 2 (PPK2 family)
MRWKERRRPACDRFNESASCRVACFEQPSEVEPANNFLLRIEQKTPECGEIIVDAWEVRPLVHID